MWCAVKVKYMDCFKYAEETPERTWSMFMKEKRKKKLKM